ncbi:uncharacterized protein Z518_02264 [Rhinocladiella mackenziei CBS 650.93]|uniref:PNPLA domain-containing protein n=1 Tax=Rhinocladiella mackenziei CBS 650.93 TaxID=1442369 RepID=A0A0D2IWD6_9EURO|nr:uncharacterized protein Z518_02264 [Rhinocladiella mackenziei CBS 650.93]KIX07611.1 hypothetical protein Z518_02264 [Rhinocladiella mackenziei CBS 650.93]
MVPVRQASAENGSTESKIVEKILTLDGGGLQALVTLSSINAVCRAVAKQNGAARPPAPRELFDMIGGVGIGGWIALLLGRYQLDIAACMAMYMEIARKVDVETNNPNAQRMSRSFRLDQDRLTTVVEETLERYDLNPVLMRQGEGAKRQRNGTSRCQYAFAAGVVQRQNKQQEKYQLFRSYNIEEYSRNTSLPGPNPENYRMPEVFAATGAVKFFLRPYQIKNTIFFDEIFPQSHPITSIALEEAFGLYGQNVDISVLLNIGPGIPSQRDCEELDLMCVGPMIRLTRKFSWPKGRHFSIKQRLLGQSESQDEETSKLTSPSEIALKLNEQRRLDICARLRELYGDSGSERYHHLGPDYSMEGASLNDVHAINLLGIDRMSGVRRASLS